VDTCALVLVEDIHPGMDVFSSQRGFWYRIHNVETTVTGGVVAAVSIAADLSEDPTDTFLMKPDPVGYPVRKRPAHIP